MGTEQTGGFNVEFDQVKTQSEQAGGFSIEFDKIATQDEQTGGFKVEFDFPFTISESATASMNVFQQVVFSFLDSESAYSRDIVLINLKFLVSDSASSSVLVSTLSEFSQIETDSASSADTYHYHIYAAPDFEVCVSSFETYSVSSICSTLVIESSSSTDIVLIGSIFSTQTSDNAQINDEIFPKSEFKFLDSDTVSSSDDYVYPVQFKQTIQEISAPLDYIHTQAVLSTDILEAPFTIDSAEALINNIPFSEDGVSSDTVSSNIGPKFSRIPYGRANTTVISGRASMKIPTFRR
jgi:hypothetical protein